MKTLHLDLGERGYDIFVGHGLLASAGELLSLDRKVFIVTDSGVPSEYAKKIAACAKESLIVTVNSGEGAKSLEVYGELLRKMIEFGLTRTDCAVAVGGGVVGDLTGYLCASYMRGIDFYNVPTTLLSQVDSSIGGKTAINHGGVKNIVGAFHQPKAVLIDLDTLRSLPSRQISNGIAESIKMALTSDAELFHILESSEEISDDVIDEVVWRSLLIKKDVVEKDEHEAGLRKILNFGHTFGHAVEAELEMQGLYHGECVAIGMLVTSSAPVLARLLPVLKKFNLPTEYNGNLDTALGFISHDKKCDGSKISVIFVDEIGSYRTEKMPTDTFVSLVRDRIK